MCNLSEFGIRNSCGQPWVDPEPSGGTLKISIENRKLYMFPFSRPQELFAYYKNMASLNCWIFARSREVGFCESQRERDCGHEHDPDNDHERESESKQ